MKKEIILASASPRRKQLLEMAEIPFRVQTADIDESFPAGMSPFDAPVFIAKNKAAVIARQCPEAVIIAADTVVILDNTIIGKPEDEADAKRILQLLSDNMHHVVTGVAIVNGEQITALSDTTEVYFNPLTTGQIAHYVEKYKPMDKAGAYAIQEWIGAIAIGRINGDFYNVMGLPVNKVVRELQRSGID